MKNFYELIAKSHRDVNNLLISKDLALDFLNKLIQLLFPHQGSSSLETAEEVERDYQQLEAQLVEILKPFCGGMKHDCRLIAKKFFKDLPDIYQMLGLDAREIYIMDPAATSTEEVITTYPGFYAILVHRIAHWFYQSEIPLLPRIFSEQAHQLTGIDIHPGAQISQSFAIDHGTGIVIGETCIIKERVRIYQGVTLGGLVVDKSMQNKQRHPTIEDDVIIYANATILGGNTVIGAGSIIGGNVWLTESVPANSKVYHQSQTQIKSQ